MSKLEIYFIEAPCIFCGYNGQGFYQADTHNARCPYRKIGGEASRIKFMRETFLPYLIFLYNSTIKLDLTKSVIEVDRAKLKRSISNWIKVSETIYKDISEEELLMMLELEKAGKNRQQILTKIYARYNKLRSSREREALLENAK